MITQHSGLWGIHVSLRQGPCYRREACFFFGLSVFERTSGELVLLKGRVYLSIYLDSVLQRLLNVFRG